MDRIISLPANKIKELAEDFVCLAEISDPHDTVVTEQLTRINTLLCRNDIEALQHSHSCVLLLLDRVDILCNKTAAVRPLRMLLREYIDFGIDAATVINKLLRLLSFARVNDEMISLIEEAVIVLDDAKELIVSKLNEDVVSLVFYKLVRLIVLTQSFPVLAKAEAMTLSLLTYLAEHAALSCAKSGSELLVLLLYFSKSNKLRPIFKKLDATQLTAKNALSPSLHVHIVTSNVPLQTSLLLEQILRVGMKSSYLPQMRWLVRTLEHVPGSHIELAIVDLIRYIVVVAEDAPGAVIARWAVVGYLLNVVTGESARSMCKQALFLEWALPSSYLDDVNKYMSILRVGAEVIVYSTKQYLALSKELFEFMLMYVEENGCWANLEVVLRLFKINAQELLSALLSVEIFGETLAGKLATIELSTE